MGVIRSFIGGLIGAAIAVAISSFLNVESSTGYAWFPILIGFLTGLGAMILGGKNFGISSMISGAAAAAIALVAILTGADAALLMSQSTADFGPTLSKEQMEKSTVSVKNAKEPTDPTSDEEGTADSDDTEEPAGDEDKPEQSQDEETDDSDAAADSETENDQTSSIVLQAPGEVAGTESPLNLPKFLYSFLGVLVAYQMGRGFGSKKKPEEVPTERNTEEVDS